MHTIYALARIYPFWALPSCVIFYQLGRFFKRKGKPLYIPCYALIVFMAFTSLLWLVFRGDLHSDEWVKLFFGA